MTNVLVEGGSRLLDALFDIYAIDEVHVFTAPKDAGGDSADGAAVAGSSRSRTSSRSDLDGDEYLRARLGP